MNKSETQARIEREALAALPELPRDEDGPVFAEPWQAQAFSITCALYENGLFSWGEWTQTFGAVIREMPDDHGYYQCWLTALERIVVAKGFLDRGLLGERQDAWDRAARATPHGEPIVLGREERNE